MTPTKIKAKLFYLMNPDNSFAILLQRDDDGACFEIEITRKQLGNIMIDGARIFLAAEASDAKSPGVQMS